MTTMIRLMRLMTFGLAVGIAGAALADAATEHFLASAVQGNLAEVRMGELAQKRGTSKDVRDFGQMLVTDHGKGLQTSSSLAKSLGVTPPTEPTAEAKRNYDSLAKLSGDEFDRQFVMHMIMDHQKDIGEYEKQARAGSDAKVAAFAKETLPTLQKHLATARSLQKDGK